MNDLPNGIDALVEKGIPPETMQFIRNGGVPRDQQAQAFWNVCSALHHAGITCDTVVAILEKHPKGIAARYRGGLRAQVEKIPVRAPFLTCHSPFLLLPFRGSNSSFDHRTTVSGRNGIFGKSDLILHVEDEIKIARFSTGIDFRHSGISIHRLLDIHDASGSDTFLLGSSQRGMGGELFDLSVKFGAENAAVAEAHFKMSKRDMYLGMAKELRGLTAQTMRRVLDLFPVVSTWRAG
jgi:hypothetical protein